MDKLKEIYNDESRFIVERRAIGAHQGSAPFFYLAKEAKESLPELPFWYDQLGSFSRQHIISHFVFDVENYIRCVNIEVSPLSVVLELFDFLGASFLHIDTEGYDLEVCKTLDFSKSNPDVMLIEHKHLSYSDLRELIRLLQAAKYRIYDTGADLLALSTSGDKLMHVAVVERFIKVENFSSPPSDP